MTPPPPPTVPPPIDQATARLLPPGEVPNPEYARLYHAYRDAYGSIDQLRRALDPPLKTLNGTDAWLGPEARSWGERLEENRRMLQQAAEQILRDLHAALIATPRTIQRV
ncbi:MULTISPECIES: hypothetical protein [Thermomonospora]|uniref:Uncharacterized protein n=1 Tax=Thermomonospora curvata (strain ATCC 19995 / DSM 43183 / JCM 3096 / KCTC 9072 / NBRC 15933 / NCIMB 10081 / Henssen B9) TaxID=471852 RepID=D1A8S8_THECD|nr:MULTISPECIES: hypothetical protein [Thermomonospora]ACY98566.1 hypothetical protein Tcur_3024 [Thermomonospora curvata DSM 43183]PKK13706.1 MAG: hypothetical protein BUE48_014750 [Thermomonospora sp. CIF 1]